MGNAIADPDDRGSATVVPGNTASDPTAAEDLDAYTAFYRSALPRLIAFLRYQGAPLVDAADCAQESLATAYLQWKKLHQPYAWCRLVASRTYGRRVAAIREYPTDEVEHRGAALGADAVAESIEQHHKILGLLDDLPPRQRQVMAWTFDGATPAEIADVLRMSDDAVRSSLYKARSSLRRLVSEMSHD